MTLASPRKTLLAGLLLGAAVVGALVVLSQGGGGTGRVFLGQMTPPSGGGGTTGGGMFGQCQKTGQQCTSNAQCCSGLVCGNQGGCCAAFGEVCGGPGAIACCNQQANSCSPVIGSSPAIGRCANCQTSGLSCGPGTPCCAGSACTNGTCVTAATTGGTTGTTGGTTGTSTTGGTTGGGTTGTSTTSDTTGGATGTIDQCRILNQACSGQNLCCPSATPPLTCISGFCQAVSATTGGTTGTIDQCRILNQACSLQTLCCPSFACVSGFCQAASATTGGATDESTLCGNGTIDYGEQCDPTAPLGAGGGTCCTAACTFQQSGTVCRAALDLCDREETCTGNSATCPAETLKPNGTVCRTAAGPCDKEEKCTGIAVACPPDQFFGPTVACQEATPTCHELTCSGTSAPCPTVCQNTPPDYTIADRVDCERDFISFPISAQDAENDTLTYAASCLPDGISLQGTTITGTIHITAATTSVSFWSTLVRLLAQLVTPSGVQPCTPTVTVSDGHGGTTTKTFDWTINALSQEGCGGSSSIGFQSIVCGDGKVQGAESCDDGNTANSDGCSASCMVEEGWQCVTVPQGSLSSSSASSVSSAP